ncbi:hypothetical protein [Victivallis sp. Marseille-Q1083]|uniref:hypothetical protein n=1 Tax=Victivallis sp. Marseille-Q1083 TaxID=2717288 RepID=UPI00158CEF42|nr:hypothetical protein [Victivallis sp. Marseille-Q1083]
MLINRIFHLSIGWLLNSLAYSIIYPFLPLYLHQYHGIDMKLVGLSFPCMAVGAMIGRRSPACWSTVSAAAGC